MLFIVSHLLCFFFNCNRCYSLKFSISKVCDVNECNKLHFMLVDVVIIVDATLALTQSLMLRASAM